MAFERSAGADTPSLRSADLEMTVPMLIQIDKLVQLIESPVFTCESTGPRIW